MANETDLEREAGIYWGMAREFEALGLAGLPADDLIPDIETMQIFTDSPQISRRCGKLMARHYARVDAATMASEG